MPTFADKVDSNMVKKALEGFYGPELVRRCFGEKVKPYQLRRIGNWTVLSPERYALLATMIGQAPRTTFSAKPIPDRIEERLVKLSLQEVPLTKKGIAERMNVKPHQLDFLLGRYGMEPFWSNSKKGNDGTGSMNKYVKAYYDQAGKTCVDQYAKKKGFHATSEFVRYALDRIMELDEPKTAGTAS